MEVIKKMGLRRTLSLIIMVMGVLFVVSIFAIVTSVTRGVLSEAIEQSVGMELLSANSTLNMMEKSNGTKNDILLSNAELMSELLGGFKEQDQVVMLEGTPTKLWTLNGKEVQNSDLAKLIAQKSGSHFTIFQKTDAGYVRIVTTVKNSNGSDAVGTILSYDSPVVKTIESGQKFEGIADILGSDYLAYYMPLKINGVIRGMFFTGTEMSILMAQNREFSTSNILDHGRSLKRLRGRALMVFQFLTTFILKWEKILLLSIELCLIKMVKILKSNTFIIITQERIFRLCIPLTTNIQN